MISIIAESLQRLEMRDRDSALAIIHTTHISLPTSRLWDSHLSFTTISLSLSLTHPCLPTHHGADFFFFFFFSF